MATRPIFNVTDKASTNPVTVGNALSADLCTQAFPESYSKRNRFILTTLNATATTGNTATELFIEGLQNFRFRVAERSTALLKVFVAYNNNVAASNTAFELTVAVQNVGGILTLLGTPLVVKYPGASTANVAVSVDNPTQALVFTATGVAGDSNGRWKGIVSDISEILDVG